MPRTLDPAAHAVRRDAFVDAALRLIQEKGYEQLSIQDVLDDVGASRGAFYHYFDSKAELLAAVIDRMVEVGVGNVAPIADDPGLGAVEKLQQVFAGIARWKSRQPEFQPEAVAELVRTWYSDENSVVLQRLRAATAAHLTPVLAKILRQGERDGSFDVDKPEATAGVLTALLLGMQDAAIRLFIGRRDGTVPFETVRLTIASYTEAFERILGLTRLAWPLTDDTALRYWFG